MGIIDDNKNEEINKDIEKLEIQLSDVYHQYNDLSNELLSIKDKKMEFLSFF